MKRWTELYEEPPEADQTPVEMPVQAPETTQEMLGRMIAQHLERESQRQGFGTWQEEDDFEDEDPNLLDLSPYELQELQGDEELPDPEEPPPPSLPLPETERSDGGEAAPEEGGADQAPEPPVLRNDQ